jgi:hypothetical protein
MLVGGRETEYGGGEDHKVYTLVLHDMHREYTGDFDSRIDGQWYGQTELAWSTSGVIDTLSELRGFNAEIAESQARKLARDFLPHEFIEREGGDDAYLEAVWRLTGSKEYLALKFDQLAKALDVDSVSGDDDAFDYWPNTMDMLWDFACDLDQISPVVGTWRSRVWEVAKKVYEGTVESQVANARPEFDKAEIRRDAEKLFVDEWGLDLEGRVREDWRAWGQQERG